MRDVRLFTVVAALALAGATVGAARGAAPAWHSVVPAFERFHAGGSPSAAGGRLLISALGCTACHAAPEGFDAAAKPGPVLDGIGGRVYAQWLRGFLSDPQGTKPGTIMPDVLAGMDGRQRGEVVESLVHLLAGSVKSPWKSERVPVFTSAWTGDDLFHAVGCAACHVPDGSRFPFADLGRKYTLESLTGFLLKPLAHWPDGRMPDLGLGLQEASDVASYLLGRERVKTDDVTPVPRFEVDRRLAGEGMAAFGSLGCANCHGLRGTAAGVKGKPLASLARKAEGCLSEQAPAGSPHYALSGAERAAILAALADLSPRPAGEEISLTMERLNCFACHEREGRGGAVGESVRFFTGDPDLGDEGRFPPRLSGAGRKLTREWLEKVLAGKGAVRPYLRTRMPVFGDRNVGRLAEGLIAADAPAQKETAAALASGDVEAGRVLMGTGGLSCITCHRLRGRGALAMQALDLVNTPERLRPEWFRANLLNPAAVRPGTLMPAFFINGKSAATHVLGGDPDRQIAAIWAYLRDGKKEPDGYPPPRGEFELVPGEKPAMLRCFMKAAGTHAIAVGFSQKVHFAFDAEKVRPAVAWRGKFLDAYSTWFSRAQPPVEPLGDHEQMLPAVMPLAVLGDSRAAWPEASGGEAGYRFAGYRLDKAGVPTFLYRFRDVDVEDRIVPGEAGVLRRTLVLRGGGEGLYFNPGQAKGLTVRVLRPQASDVPIPVQFNGGKAVVEVEYQW